MRIDLVFPVLPPTLDGIGDHTVRMAEIMARECEVRILTAQHDVSPIPGVDIEQAFEISPVWKTKPLLEEIQADPPDWVVLQFNQFSYGRWGFNPFLPRTMQRVSHASPGTQIAWIAHEDFMPASSLKNAIMSIWQRWQFKKLGQLSDLIFFSIDPWVHKYSPWFRDTPVHHLPIGSNMPRVTHDPSALREQLGLNDTFVAGFFGTLRARLTGHVKAAMTELQRLHPGVVLLYIGPDGPGLRRCLPDTKILDVGRLTPIDVSRHLGVFDLHLCPFVDGVSTRRGSFMAGLQHGIPTLSTSGELTDQSLLDSEGDAFILTPRDDASLYARAALELSKDDQTRRQIGRTGQDLYDKRFAFEVTIPTMLDILRTSNPDATHETYSLHAHR